MTRRSAGAALIVAALLALALAPQALAGGPRIALRLPAVANVGERVAATGSVIGRFHRRRVFLQRLSGRRWRVLASARLTRPKSFKAAFAVPNRPGVLLVRAILYRHGRRPLRSRTQRIAIRAPATPPAAAPATGIAAAWGQNNLAQLGGGFKSDFSATPVGVLGLNGVKSVAATYFTSYALMNDGAVQAWGGGAFGQLGNGTYEQAATAHPVTVRGLSGVTAIAAGGAHAMALLSNGTVATWGGNTYGMLGNGTSLKGATGPGSNTPVIVPGLSGVVAIAAGGGDDAALLSNGTVVAWGENRQGQLGDGTTLEKDVPTPVGGLAGVTAIAVGGIPSLGGHLLALLSNGTVMAVGGNDWGQLGDGTTTDRSRPVAVKGLSGVSAIAASFSHSVALLENGSVVAWGNNAYGELGGRARPESCGKEPVPCSRLPVATGMTNASSVAAGFRFSLALGGGQVYGWGTNEQGQLGDGTTTSRAAPAPVTGLSEVGEIAAGEKHSMAVLRGGAPSAPITVTAGVGSLTVSWSASPGTEPWGISWRVLAKPPLAWGPFLKLAPATRSYTISGLSPVPYEVVVRNKSFGRPIGIGTPLG